MDVYILVASSIPHSSYSLKLGHRICFKSRKLGVELQESANPPNKA